MKNYQDIFDELISNHNIHSDDKIYTEFFDTFVSDTSQEIIKTLNESFNSYLDKENIQAEQFIARNFLRWKNLFNLFNLLIKCCTESIEIFLERNKENLENSLFNTLIQLHAKACLLSNEILWLCKGGYADGAHARWRSLHEITCTSLFITKHGEDCAERYIAHSLIDDINFYKEYEKYKNRIKMEFNYDKELIDHQFKELTKLFGSNFKNNYGWAEKFFHQNHRVGFASIEKNVDLDHFKPFYKWSSQSIHAVSLNLQQNLAMSEASEKILLIGSSNSSMSLPISSSAISLSILTINLLNYEPIIDDLISMNVIQFYLNQIESTILEKS